MLGNLVLSRRLGESIAIGPDAIVTVVELRGDKVRLAVKAPKEVSVDRLEVRELKAAHASQQEPRRVD